jgi:release factor glutamine methyltransferase
MTKSMLSVLEIIKKTTDFFASKGVESPRLNAELLIGHALGLKRMQLYLQFERLLAEAELEKIRPLVRRRALREPLQYILGETEWYGLKLKTDKRALIPRPETELLMEFAVKAAKRPEVEGVPAGGPTRILDLGTGTGALALALAKEFPEAKVTAVDASEDALALAKENAVALGLSGRVTFLKSDWFSAVPESNEAAERFELIVSNPPYLTEAEVAEAEAEVRAFEPVSALIAADAGAADLRTIIAGAPAFLSEGGVLALETGIAQHADLLAACAAAGFARSESRQDLTGRDRFVVAWK